MIELALAVLLGVVAWAWWRGLGWKPWPAIESKPYSVRLAFGRGTAMTVFYVDPALEPDEAAMRRPVSDPDVLFGAGTWQARMARAWCRTS